MSDSQKLKVSPEVVLAGIDAAIRLVEVLAPTLKEYVQRGDITVEQQTALMNRMADLDRLELFTGPEWRVDPDPPTELPTP